ncbi:MAG: archaellin/type IV pilin N-terminal domain-containing protein [Nanoarchaeota archaeon]
MNKKAEMGIGTLIIFIAMILVAAIAASVLIQTATSLQNKALLTGKRTQGQISTATTVLLVYGENGTTGDPKSLDRFFVKLKLAPGSDAIRLNDTLLECDVKDASADLTYNQSDGDCSQGDYMTDTDGHGNYSARYLLRGNEWRNGYIHRGDVVELCFEAPSSVLSDEDISIRFIPKVGMPTVLETAVPEIIGQERIYIFP